MSTCASCSGGPSKGSFTIKELKTERLTLTSIEMSIAEMSNYNGVSLCGGCLAKAAHGGIAMPSGQKDQASSSVAGEPKSKAPDSTIADAKDDLPSAIADEIERLQREGFDPEQAMTTTSYSLRSA